MDDKDRAEFYAEVENFVKRLPVSMHRETSGDRTIVTIKARGGQETVILLVVDQDEIKALSAAMAALEILTEKPEPKTEKPKTEKPKAEKPKQSENTPEK